MQKSLIVRCDGGARGNPGPAAAAAVLSENINGEEKVVAEAAEYLGEATNNQAEYQGLIIGLTKAKELGAREVTVLMDSELVVRQMNKEYRVKNEDLAKKYLAVHGLAQAFNKIAYRHVTRDKNTRADELVNRVLDEQKTVL